jgi:hypothetical protein
MSQNRGQCMEQCQMLTLLQPPFLDIAKFWHLANKVHAFTYRIIKFSCHTVVSSHAIYGHTNKMTPRIPNTHPETGLLLCLGRQFPHIKQSAGTNTPDFWPFAFFRAQGYLTGVQITANACRFKKTLTGTPQCPNRSPDPHKNSRNGVRVTTELPF